MKKNRARGVDTWNRLTDVRGEVGGQEWIRLDEEHICIHNA